MLKPSSSTAPVICTQKPLLIMGTVLHREAQAHSQRHICEAPLLALSWLSSCLSGSGSRCCSHIFRVHPHYKQAQHDRHFRWDSNGEPLFLLFVYFSLLLSTLPLASCWEEWSLTVRPTGTQLCLSCWLVPRPPIYRFWSRVQPKGSPSQTQFPKSL